MKKNKIAIVSDVMMSVGGAENVTEVIISLFPKADFYTLFLTPKARERIEKKFPKVKIYTSCFQRLISSNNPNKYISIVKTISWLYWEILDLSKYDLIISSSNSFMSKNVKKRKGALHVSYIHAPPRYLYNEFNQIGWIKKNPWKWVLWPLIKILRLVDKRGVNRPDIMIAASNFVQKRIRKYYERDSIVVYPPVNVEKLGTKNKYGEYYLCLSRLVKQKGIDLVVRTAVKNNLRLVVAGEGYERDYLENISKGKVCFVGNKEGIEKVILLKNAKALIYSSIEEDFGIVPVEALMLGTPVIAYNSGGVLETVVDGKNGVLFQNFSEKSLWMAIKRFEGLRIRADICRKSVEKFSQDSFEKRILDIISNGQKKRN